MKCTNSIDTSANDLEFIRELELYKAVSETVSLAGIRAIHRHLWYLGEECVTFSLFSDIVSNDIKSKMQTALRIFNRDGYQRNKNSIKLVPEEIEQIYDRN